MSLSQLQSYLFGRLGVHDAGAKVADEVENEEGVGDTVEDEPAGAHILVVEKRDDHGQEDDVGHDQH